MKKITLAILMTFGIFTMVSADIGVKLGVSAQIGSMEASGSETNSDGVTPTQKSGNREALFGTGGFFIEKDLAFLPGRVGDLGSRIHIGFDNIVHDLDVGTVSNRRDASLGAAGAVTAPANHSLNAKITGFETVYATINITDWLYVKAGSVTMDVDTVFKGSATSSYAKSHSLDGTVMGFGLVKSTDTGWFTRLEYNDYDIDGKTVQNAGTDSKFAAVLSDVSGSTGRISIGKAF
ncbi:hypothetical protein N8906_00920 [Candidatus Pelagibacter sp.]|nr:hypothetical protein [Candidatus Pelagibacter sp.]